MTRANNPVEEWNSELSKKFKVDAAESTVELARTELCLANEKRKRKCIPLDGRIKRAIENDADNDLLKC